jgi:putative transposase
LAEAGIEPSVGSVGDSYDNALAETINGLYKAEVNRPEFAGGSNS